MKNCLNDSRKWNAFHAISRWIAPLFVCCALSAPLWSQGAGFALEFGGTNEYITLGNDASLLITGDLTIEAWVFIPSPPGDNGDPATSVFSILTFGTNGEDEATNQVYRLQVADANLTPGVTDYDFQLVHEYNGGIDQIINCPDDLDPVFGVWQHIAVVRNVAANSVVFYRNGVTRSSVNFSFDPTGGSSGVGVIAAGFGSTDTGDDIPPAGGLLTGRLDEVRVWNAQVSQTNIRAWQNKAVTASHPNFGNLQGYWRLDEGSGTSTADETGTNNGTLQNMESGDWVGSLAAVGDGAQWTQTGNIAETADVPISITFAAAPDDRGAEQPIATIQVNEAPNNTSGITGNNAPLYWELWAANNTLDGTFSATVNFHFDDIPGIGDESTLVLYRRDNSVDPSWTTVPIILINNEGNSNDGVGSIEITLDETDGINGQYIIASADADNPLPVQLLSLRAAARRSGIALEWSTASEVNNVGFEIRRRNRPGGPYHLVDSYVGNGDLRGAGTTTNRTDYVWIDASVADTGTYTYQLVSVDLLNQRQVLGTVSASARGAIQAFELAQNYPNPFNGTTRIPVSIGADAGSASLVIYDVLGREIRRYDLSGAIGGRSEVVWDATDGNGLTVPSGQYLYQLDVDGRRTTRTLLYVR